MYYYIINNKKKGRW